MGPRPNRHQHSNPDKMERLHPVLRNLHKSFSPDTSFTKLNKPSDYPLSQLYHPKKMQIPPNPLQFIHQSAPPFNAPTSTLSASLGPHLNPLYLFRNHSNTTKNGDHGNRPPKIHVTASLKNNSALHLVKNTKTPILKPLNPLTIQIATYNPKKIHSITDPNLDQITPRIFHFSFHTGLEGKH